MLRQVDPDWELCLVGDGATPPALWRILDDYAALDGRIRVSRLPWTRGSVDPLNRALALATGEFVAPVDPGDELVASALGAVAAALAGHDGPVDLCYTDEAVRRPTGFLGQPLYKPDWSPERMRSTFYTGRLAALRRSVALELGGFRAEYEGAHEYDLTLRVAEGCDGILHVPQVLYHR
ncbi:MAG: glycosyltransferase, partial [Thermoplasmata archaeon]|nr:glycosyltransferase [Thermoplasmata archaeon]